jgi:hypothetical protein
MRTGFVRWFAQCAQLLKTLGPYAAIELVLPGGSLIALLLWLSNRRKSRADLEVRKCWPAIEAACRLVRTRLFARATAQAAP